MDHHRLLLALLFSPLPLPLNARAAESGGVAAKDAKFPSPPGVINSQAV